MYTLIIADDHSIVRDGIRPLFAARNDVNIVKETRDGLETISAIKSFKPDVVLLDLDMPFASALEICVEAKRWSPATRLIVFTGINNGTVLKELIAEGVRALVLKSEDNQQLNTAFNAVVAGKIWISEAASALLESANSSLSLTSRERQILKFIVAGNTTKEIGQLLSLSSKTIENHRGNLMRKLDVHSVSELMALAYRERLVSPADFTG